MTKETRIINRIYEYDIRSANTSSLRTAKKLKVATLDELEQLPRHDREVQIGKMIAQDRSIGKVIKREISRAKQQLFMANHVQDEEVLSVKNDAVFIIGRRLPVRQFGFMEFKEKNVYAGYLYMDKLELYYDRKHRTVDIKGIKDEIVKDPDHQKGIVSFLAQVMEYLVMDRMDALRRYLIEFTDDYKSKRLPVEFYKEMSGDNGYRSLMELATFYFQMQTASEEDKETINGIYNFKRFVLPMIQMFV
ncbi:MAG: hypothetical protein NC489_09060 [Ruminococcus flavefaciens]|nr:hypothetical protein [Ruminococcus flavefaciens]